MNRRHLSFREPFCAVIVNFFYGRHLLFRSGRKRKSRILSFMRLISSFFSYSRWHKRCFGKRSRELSIPTARTKKVVAHERILTPRAGSHLSHNLVPAQIQTVKRQRRRTDAAVLRVDWQETRLTFPA